jgi:hypothetical protein
MCLVYAVLPYSVSMACNPRLYYLYPRFCSAIQVRCPKVFNKSVNRIKFVCAGMVTWNKPRTEDPQILDAALNKSSRLGEAPPHQIYVSCRRGIEVFLVLLCAMCLHLQCLYFSWSVFWIPLVFLRCVQIEFGGHLSIRRDFGFPHWYLLNSAFPSECPPIPNKLSVRNSRINANLV